MFTRSTVVKVLYGGSIISGAIAFLCGVVFVFSPKHGIAVAMVYSLVGGIGAALLGLVLGIAGYALKVWRSPDE